MKNVTVTPSTAPRNKGEMVKFLKARMGQHVSRPRISNNPEGVIFETFAKLWNGPSFQKKSKKTVFFKEGVTTITGFPLTEKGNTLWVVLKQVYHQPTKGGIENILFVQHQEPQKELLDTVPQSPLILLFTVLSFVGKSRRRKVVRKDTASKVLLFPQEYDFNMFLNTVDADITANLY